jgi:hypothetical protein
MIPATKIPPFEVRHPHLSRLSNWPVMCTLCSVAFLAIVYILGNFGDKDRTERKKLENKPAVALSATATQPRN